MPSSSEPPDIANLPLRDEKRRRQRNADFAILPRASGDRPSGASRIPIKPRTEKSMKASYQLAFCLLVLLGAGLGASRLPFVESSAAAAQKAKTSAAPAAQQSDIERGRYLVENVAMCWECHTPRDENGNPDRSRWLQGAPIWIMPVRPTTNWSMHAPALAGFPGFTEEQGEQILEKGVGPNGLPIQPPMHVYHMNHADAVAIIAYLRSLPSSYPR
jgi:mono/diheme cytochrome c family protein